MFLGDNQGTLQVLPITVLDAVMQDAAEKGFALTHTAATVTGTTVNLRSGPGTEHPVTAQVRQGDQLNVQGQNAAGDWLQIPDPAGGPDFHWIAASLTDLTAADREVLPVAEAGVPVAGLPIAKIPEALRSHPPANLLDMAVPIEGLVFQLDTLFLLTPRVLQAYFVQEGADGPNLHLLGEIPVPGTPSLHEWRRSLAVHGNRAYVGGLEGLTEINISDPLTMQVVRWPAVGQGMIQDLAPVGDHTLLALTQFNAESVRFLAVLDTSPQFSRVEPIFLIPAAGQFERLAVVDGLTYVAAGTAGLSVLNVLGYQMGIPPGTPLLRSNLVIGQREADLPTILQASVVGKGWLRRMELYQEGELWATDATAPFAFALPHDPQPDTWEFRFVDHRGQETSASFALQMVEDAQPPRLLNVTPGHNSFDLLMVTDRRLSLKFSEPIEPATPERPVVQLLYRSVSQEGHEVFQDVPLSWEMAGAGTEIQITLPEDLHTGEYLLLTHPELRDAAGNSMHHGLVREYILYRSLATPEEEGTGSDSGQESDLESRPLTKGNPVLGPFSSTILQQERESSRHSSTHLSGTLLTSEATGTEYLTGLALVGNTLTASRNPAQNPQTVEEELLAAVRANDIEKAKELLVAGANPNFGSDAPLYIAAGNGHAEMVELLLSVGADPTAQKTDGWTPLHLAAPYGYLDVAQLLLAAGSNLHRPTLNGEPPIWLAVKHRQVEMATWLLAEGANVHFVWPEGDTLLHRAAGNGHAEMVELLLSVGADPTAQKTDGWTPLHLAAPYGYLDVAQLLLAAGADPSIQDKDGVTPLQLAVDFNHENVATLFEREALK